MMWAAISGSWLGRLAALPVYTLWSLEFLMVWPMLAITSAIVANFGFAMWRAGSNLQSLWKKEYRLVWLGFLFMPATLIVGIICAVDPARVTHPIQNSPGLRTIQFFIAATAAYGIFWIYRMKGLRWLAFAIVCVQLWVLMGAQFVAGMALTGDWL